jgi:hypothetical protein
MTKKISSGSLLIATGIIMATAFQFPNRVFIGSIVGYTQESNYGFIQILGIVLGFVIIGVGLFVKNKE